MTAAVRGGIAPAMSCRPDCTFWGRDLTDYDDNTTTTMGGCAPPTTGTEWIARQAAEKGYNARQAADRITGAQTFGINPEYPEEVGDDDDNMVTVYCDGSTKIPRQPAWSYGGFGVWAPTADGRLRSPGKDTGIAKRTHNERGTKMWNKGPTDRCNSTRMELMAVAAGLTLPYKVHIKSDNMAVVNKTKHLVHTARRWNEHSPQTTGRGPAHTNDHGSSREMATYGDWSGKPFCKEVLTPLMHHGSKAMLKMNMFNRA